MSLAAHDLAFGYPGHDVGKDATLLLDPGEVVALLGPNGGGKTTLLKTMIGLLPPRTGKVTLDDRDLRTVPVVARARAIGYVPQSVNMAFAFTVLEVVLMGRTAHAGLFARPTANDREIASAMLERLGVSRLADQPTTMISGGERQLVLLARALAQQPRYIVLDEPTASLDFGNQGKVMRRLRDLAAEGLGILFTTHDPNHAARYADRAALLGKGRILAQGPVSEILRPEALAALYGAPVEVISEGDGRTAFLPA